MKNVLSWIRDIVIAIIIAAIILAFFKPIIVQQESMQPNFYSGDYVITSRQSYRLFGEPQRGDIIVFKSDLYDSHSDGDALLAEAQERHNLPVGCLWIADANRSPCHLQHCTYGNQD